MISKRNLSIADLCNNEDLLTPSSTPKIKRVRLHKQNEPSVSNMGFTPPLSRHAKGESKPPSTSIRHDAIEPVNYHAHITSNAETRKQHRRFCLYPDENIEDYPSHVAFKSDKRGFQTQTGRSGFEIFEYTFRYTEPSSGESDTRSLVNDKEWRIVWDYNIGLVRIASLFKWQHKYQKTMPIKAIEATEGLFPLCHSITGGKTDYQGFWVPFPAAKALAATFCYKIRHALTPMFGDDFVEQCLEPDDALFQNYTISRAIVRQCAQQADLWKRLAASYRVQPSLELVRDGVAAVVEEGRASEERAVAFTGKGTRALRKRRRVAYEMHDKGQVPGADAASVVDVVIAAGDSGVVESGEDGGKKHRSGDVTEPTGKEHGSEDESDWLSNSASVLEAACILFHMADAEGMEAAQTLLEFNTVGRVATV